MDSSLWLPSHSLARKASTPFSRRTLLRGAGAATAALSTSALLAACAAPGGGGGSSGNSKSLDFWQFYGPMPAGSSSGNATKAQGDWFKNVTDEWNGNNDTKVGLTYVPAASYLNGDQLATQFASGQGPDIFLISSALFLAYYNSDVMFDLTSYISDEAKADFDAGGVMGSRMVDGKIYGLPLESEPLLMFYSQDAFEEAGLSEGDIPQTWDQYLDVAEKLTASSRFGALWETTPGAFQNFAWYPFMWQGDGDAVTGGKASFNSPGAVGALKFWQDAIDSGVAPRTVQGGTGSDVVANLASGYVAMQEMVSVSATILRDNAPDFRYGAFKLPSPDGGRYMTDSGGWAAVVNKHGKNPEAAAEFVAWALASTDDEGVARMAEWATVAKEGDLSPRASANELARQRGYFDDPSLKYVLEEVVGDGSGVRSEPRYPTEVFKSISDAVQSSMLNGVDPQEAADIANDQIASFLSGYEGGEIV